jgi:hypothetical protein
MATSNLTLNTILSTRSWMAYMIVGRDWQLRVHVRCLSLSSIFPSPGLQKPQPLKLLIERQNVFYERVAAV